MVICFVSNIYAQKKIDDLYIAPEMYEHFGRETIDRYRQTDPAQLARLNYKMINYAMVSSKLPDGDCQMLDNPEAYAKEGVTTDEDAIIGKGWINPFLYDFPQDEYKTNVFPLHHTGFYVFVIAGRDYEARSGAFLRQYGF